MNLTQLFKSSSFSTFTFAVSPLENYDGDMEINCEENGSSAVKVGNPSWTKDVFKE